MANFVERLKECEKEIQKAQLEKNLRQQQIAELKPTRAMIEEESQSQFGCSITELPNQMATMETELKELVEKLEKSLSAAKSEI